VKDAVERLDTLMRKLIEADQTGAGIEPLKVADELDTIRALLFRSPTVRPAPGGQRHFRCETCGTISHGPDEPAACEDCGGTAFFDADLKQPNVESGAG
jgi:hypothetical protein